ncbi:MAG: penicillin-binding protein 2 [Candidatus Solincola sediminis]|uniref:Beta-lactamase n=1 Tax=Candidatus Solincola sediminis TaxID=1797199 RepID=A0A1F2WQ46_9ACTN|nr:MAG: penicillin-binding protein 2 [Candidatus Solincola sediminis]
MAFNPQQKSAMLHRFTLFVMFLVVLISVLVIRLWFLQVVQGDHYKAMAEGNRIREVSLEAQRGNILDRNDKDMVINRQALSIFVQPTEFQKLENKEEEVQRLASMLDMEPLEIMQKLQGDEVQPHKPVLIKKDVDPETWFYIAERQVDFPWVSADEMPVREYKEGEEMLAAHVLGYLGEISEEQLQALKDKGYKAGDIVGTSGVEAYYEDILRGIDGKRLVEVDAQGMPLQVLGEEERNPGETVVLTIDKDLQKVVEESLRAGILASRTYYDTEREKNFASPAGAAVVLDPTNGEILAMASEPTFNLENFVGGIDELEWVDLTDPENDYPLNNRAIVGQYPPGSTFKVVTALASLKDLGVTAYSPFSCNHTFTEGEFEDFPKTCWGTHGSIDFMDAIIQSCDTVFYHLGYQFYQKREQNGWVTRLQDYATLSGLGKATGVDLPNEFEGRVPTPQWKWEFNQGNPDYQQWYPGDTVNMAVGQGDILLTPLQLANVYAAIANGGPFYRPHIGKETLTWQGETVEMIQPVQIGDLTSAANPEGVSVSKANLDVVQSALTGVVSGGGTAAGVFQGFPLGQIPVAGKTGTAEVAGKQPCAWFVCYAPANDPKYVVVVMIEEGGHGGMAAAPVARRILEQLFGIPSQPGVVTPTE